jgi:pyridoxamine 5'-phosphate oxidase
MNPCFLLRKWVEDAVANNIPKADTMCLSTVSGDGIPSSRMLVISDVTDSGVTFFTDTRSPKVQHLSCNANACALIYWPALAKQVRLEGRVESLDEAAADTNFDAKPYEHQLAILLCQQSSVLPKYWSLKRQYFEKFEQSSDHSKNKRPVYWRGFELRAKTIEFFKGADCRINRRLLFSRANSDKWRCIPLFP